MSINNGSLGSMRMIKMYDKTSLRSILRYYMNVDKLIDDFYEHEYNHMVPSKYSKYHCSIEEKLEVAILYEPRKMSHRSKVGLNKSI
jgi:hypothetical protein